MPGNTYTPADIAGFCDVATSTVNNWIKDGCLKAHSTPGGHHRVLREDLVAFLRQYRMPVPRELDDARKHVLIVDDERGVVEMLEHAFSMYDSQFSRETTLSGYAALLRIGERKPDLVILDVLMPEFDGWAVIDLLKASLATRDIKVLVISGGKPKPTPAELARHKVDAFLEKPFLPETLLAKAAGLLGVRLPQPFPR